MSSTQRPLAVVTGASAGIGFELAKLCASKGYDLVIAADEPEIEAAADSLRPLGAAVDALQVDLATPEGVNKLQEVLSGRPVDALFANAGHGLGHGFFDQDFTDIQHVINTNVTSTLDVIHRIGGVMRRQGRGRILITGSIAGFTPGTFQAVYNGTKAFIDSFAYAIRHELKDSGVSVTCLMPGPTDTHFFARAGMQDTKVGAGKKADPADVAKAGFDAMMRGESDVVAGWKNKLQAAVSNVLPADLLAEQHRKLAEPGSARH